MTSLLYVAGWAIGVLALMGVLAALALLLIPDLQSYPAAFLERYLFPDPNQINLKGKANSSGKTASNVFRILAFGDSLTEGFTNGGNAFHPYAKRLGDGLYPQLPQGIHLEIEEQGESGERVLFGMKDRLQRTLDEHAAAGRLYDWVLLLGGINDLAGDDSMASEVLAGLDLLVQSCLAHGASVLLMTLMEVAAPEKRVEAQRQALNAAIREYVSSKSWDKKQAATAAAAAAPAAASSHIHNSSSSSSSSGLPAGAGPLPAASIAVTAAGSSGSGAGGSAAAAAVGASSSAGRHRLRQGPPRVMLFDLEAALPFESMDPEMRFDIWDDGVHLTMHGYDYMGERVLRALLPLVKEDLAGASLTAAAGGAQLPVEADGGDTAKKLL